MFGELNSLVAIHLVCVTPSVFVALNSLILATNITYAIIKCTPFLALIAWILTTFTAIRFVPLVPA